MSERASATFREINEHARDVRRRYAKHETATFGRPWTPTEIALGFVGDVGDLAKLVQAHAGIRHIDDQHDKLAHELADCLWSIMTLADQLDVDLEAAFNDTMANLRTHLALSAEGSDQAS